MEDSTSTLFYDMANSCYRKDCIIISELKENVYILFRNRIWSMLVCVKKVLERSSNRHAHLLVDIKKSSGCAVPSCLNGVYLHGADKQKKDEEIFLYHTPFLRVGQGMSISENIPGNLPGGRNLFYELGAIFTIDFSLLC